ncbi:MAG TPA: hypothetical protein VHL57_02345 [Flavobacteriales bacterium]|jgi:hypothetical protein|nr:hypothetical protein [Flavobacteriales bacterium]
MMDTFGMVTDMARTPARTTVTRKDWDDLIVRVEVLESLLAELVDMPTEVAAEAQKKLPAKKGQAKRGVRLPEGWVPNEDTIAQIRGEFPHVTNDDLSFEHRKFADYWYGKAENATKRDWEGTWRNWMRRAFERLPQVSARRAGLSTVDQKLVDMQAMKDG